MKKIPLVLALAGLAWVLPAYAVDEHHPEDQKTPPAKTAPKESTTQKQAPAAQKPSAPAAQTGAMQMGMMGNMEKMQAQMQRLMQTQDPKEREKLLHEHMQTMQESMKMMSGMMSQGMMGGGKSGDAKSGQGMFLGMSADQRMQMMEQRMDMMQKMMEQMLTHEEQKAK